METQPRGDLSALDWIGALLAALGALFCLQMPFLAAPKFEQMFHDFGSTALPPITLLALTRWFPISVGLVPLGVLALGVLKPLPLSARRALIVAAFALSWVGGLFLLWALYSPIFRIAGDIQA